MATWTKKVYLLWAILTFVIVFTKDGLNPENITHIGIIVLFFFAFFVYRKNKSTYRIKNPKVFFICQSVFFAILVEGFYMISKPFLPSLLITSGMPLSHALRNYLIDLSFTTPAYILIFWVMWKLLLKYEYSAWEFAFIMALGQSLGDGGRTFFFQPTLLLFLPYVMINYHAMNLIPYLKIKDSIRPDRSKSPWRFIAPLLLLPATYVFCGFILYAIATVVKVG